MHAFTPEENRSEVRGMRRAADWVLLLAFVACLPAMAHSQDGNVSNTYQVLNLKTLVVANEAKSDAEVAIPPDTSAFVAIVQLRHQKHTTKLSSDLATWIRQQSALNGLQSEGVHPWHIVMTYDQFDEDGDNIHSGTFEEFWAGPAKYKRIYRSDNFNQVDYATAHGLYRRGDQRWPDPAELQVRAEVVDPFSYATTLHGFHVQDVLRSFSGYDLECASIENESTRISDPTQYCFEPEGSVLRYTRGFSWNQTTYNKIISFQGRNIALDVDVTDGGKPYLKLRVETIESLSHVDDAEFSPPPNAVGPLGDRVSGVSPVPVNITSRPNWPASLRAQHFAVKLKIVIGKNGRVASVQPVSGPPEAYKGCENAVRKWVFKPYLVLDKPVEVEWNAECTNN
jgi:hypothetical protein